MAGHVAIRYTYWQCEQWQERGKTPGIDRYLPFFIADAARLPRPPLTA